MHLLIENDTSEKIEMDADLEKTIREVLKTEGLEDNYEVSITFVDREEIQRLNKEFRNIDRQTDVLSFPLDDDMNLPGEDIMLGDIVICMDVAKDQAREFGHSLRREIMYLTCHSTLHLLGYDHMEEDDKRKMRAREKEIMRNLRVFKDDNHENFDHADKKDYELAKAEEGGDFSKIKDELKEEIKEELRLEQRYANVEYGKIYTKENLSHGQKFLKGFDYAYEGLVFAINHEKNMKFHFLTCAIVLVASLFFNLSRIEMMFLVFSISSVIALELVNTALENAVDIAADGRWLSLAKSAKDVSAAATFIAALNAIFVGYMIFFDKFLNFYDSVILRIARRPSHLALISISLIIILTIFFKGVFYEGHGTAFRGGFVSGHTSVAFGLGTIGFLLVDDPMLMIILAGLALIVAESRYEADIHSAKEIIRGAILGVSIALAIFGIFS
ncbi:rRNA maturation RNase YbeY [Anaerococcus tetradius]|uniref:Endoribonuclease YbeY n=1 Tax=Anaerococcus tetradius ATCC 35098 TaxID=525255 RepID=C2CIT2_9FIRM|nr:rRNA maturation RNase YbeY [Anaerococcus tetradius]EEI82515.1 translation metalloprotein YbeY [Anaerococcus tetradius ATCC 35098]